MSKGKGKKTGLFRSAAATNEKAELGGKEEKRKVPLVNATRELIPKAFPYSKRSLGRGLTSLK